VSSSTGTSAKPKSRRRAASDDDQPQSAVDRASNLAGYDPAHFIVPASDTKGHGVRKDFRLSVSMAREIEVIVASKLFPFMDASDLLRWCVREGLARLNAMEEVPHSVFGQAEAAMEISRELVYQKQYEAVFVQLDEAIQICRSRGALNEIRKLYARVQAKFQNMPEGFWRAYYLDELARRYGPLVDPRAAKAREAQHGIGPNRLRLADGVDEEVG
jgi:hypothetical protein